LHGGKDKRVVINKLDLITFLQHVNEKGYVAVDFYDGSIMYDFVEHKTMLCDIDFFRKKPVVNDMAKTGLEPNA